MVDVLSNAAGGIVAKVIFLAADEIIYVWGFRRHLDKLQGSFNMIRAVLNDAERQQSSREAVKQWLENLKDVSGEADDVLDEIHYEMLRRKVEIPDQNVEKVSSFFSSSNPIKFRFKMTRKIKEINKRLAEISKEAKDFGLQNEVQNPRQVTVNQLETDSFLDEFGVIGRDSNASMLIETLIGSNSEEKLIIIPIVGMAGLGKTTLAKLIFNNEQVKGHFDVKVWVCVAIEVDVKTLLVQILESLTRKKGEVQSRQNIIKSLQEYLGGKKYLLVLDDVWNSKEGAFWDDFRSCMLKVNEDRGNSIVVTTRNKGLVSSYPLMFTMHPLEQLSDDQCWSIIQERAFVAGGMPKTRDLEDTGKEIAKKCGGVPLVAKVVGDMLRSKKSKHGWLSVQNSSVWDSKEADRVMSILKLSFDNLPNSLLKQCFAYCSIFQKDLVMKKGQLIQMWMALGFLQANEARNKDMEDLGHEFFKILVQNSLFQDVEKNQYDNITHCKMHDLVHDLALSLSKSECFNSDASTSNDMIPQVRHLALYRDSGETIFAMLKEEEKTRYFRTLFLKYDYVPKNISLKFKCLRILNLSWTGLLRLPDSVGELIHLRYLDLSRSNVRILPKSVGRLYHLQTLRVKGCKYLKELPNEVRNLISLRHLYIDYDSCKFPLELGKLTSLRRLRLFPLGREKGLRIGELGCLKNLRGKLHITNLEEVSSKEEAQSADLVGKMNLDELEYEWSSKGGEIRKLNDKDVLEGLQAPENLKRLKIDGFMGDNFPEWMMKMVVSINRKWSPLDNLVDLRFSRCSRCKHVPMLGHMPHLQKLELNNMEKVKCIDGSFYGGGNDKPLFPALRSFKMMNMEKLKKWVDATTTTTRGLSVFPCLEELYLLRCRLNTLPNEAFRSARFSLKWLTIQDCPNLETIPTFQGFTSLQSLRISNCSNLTSLPSGLLGSCTSLVTLIIHGCPNLTSLLELHDQSHSLQELIIANCRKVSCLAKELRSVTRLDVQSPSVFSESKKVSFLSLPKLLLTGSRWMDATTARGSSVMVFPCLEKLDIRSSHIHLFPMKAVRSARLSLKFLEINQCPNLKTIPTLKGFTSLEELILDNCWGLTSLPSDLLKSCTSLLKLRIDVCPDLLALPDLHRQSHSLQQLRIIHCEKLTCLPKGLSDLNVLKVLSISAFTKLEDLQSFKLSLQRVLLNSKLSLRRLILYGQSEWDSIPEEVQHLTALTSITLSDFGVETLPDWFAKLSSLEELSVQGCRRVVEN